MEKAKKKRKTETATQETEICDHLFLTHKRELSKEIVLHSNEPCKEIIFLTCQPVISKKSHYHPQLSTDRLRVVLCSVDCPSEKIHLNSLSGDSGWTRESILL